MPKKCMQITSIWRPFNCSPQRTKCTWHMDSHWQGDSAAANPFFCSANTSWEYKSNWQWLKSSQRLYTGKYVLIYFRRPMSTCIGTWLPPLRLAVLFVLTNIMTRKIISKPNRESELIVFCWTKHSDNGRSKHLHSQALYFERCPDAVACLS